MSEQAPDRCNGDPANCFGYHGRYDLHTCLAANHDIDQPADGRVPCRANDKRWAELGTLTCRIHREAAQRPPVPAHRAPWPA